MLKSAGQEIHLGSVNSSLMTPTGKRWRVQEAGMHLGVKSIVIFDWCGASSLAGQRNFIV